MRIGNNWASFSKFRARKLEGLLTNIPGLDTTLFGVQGITLIQGEPASCKSSLCLQIAGHVASQGNPVFFIDRENGMQRVRTRLMCQMNEVSQADVFAASDVEEEKWAKKVIDLPIFVLNDTMQEEASFKEYVKDLYNAYKKPVLVVVDSLQALPKVIPDERINIQYWMEFFDSIKVKAEGKIYFLIVSEKRRGAYDSASLDGGKGSNAIEYKSEVVLDLRYDSGTGLHVLQCTKFRDGLSKFQINFRKVLADETDPQSFTYKLEEDLPDEDLG